jgi:hypothetical protein
MNDAEDNLRRALKRARLALISDEAYRAAVEAEEDREYQHWSDAQARIGRWAIDLRSARSRRD